MGVEPLISIGAGWGLSHLHPPDITSQNHTASCCTFNSLNYRRRTQGRASRTARRRPQRHTQWRQNRYVTASVVMDVHKIFNQWKKMDLLKCLGLLSILFYTGKIQISSSDYLFMMVACGAHLLDDSLIYRNIWLLVLYNHDLYS